jgi:hypothetical protein
MIPITNFGKDHWSTFAYAETLAVDNNGIIIPYSMRMRTNHKTHKFLGNPIDGSEYPTILRDGNVLKGHDDWDCLDDAVKLGLLKDVGTGLNRQFKLTEEGRHVANRLREHKSQGGTFKNFSEWFDKD